MKTHDYKGHTITITVHHDENMGPPWEEHDGHGIVSEWVRRDKRPGELVLITERGASRFYDVEATFKIASRDGWGLGDEALAKLASKLGRKPTHRQVIAAAVQSDFEYLRGWCRDEWQWLGFTTEIETPAKQIVEGFSCWGFDDEDYMIREAIGEAKATVDKMILTEEETLKAEAMP